MVRRIPSLNWLRVFEAAARTESFASAAKLLAMSPPAVSQQIRALEEYLGSPLFLRHAKSVELTEAGHAFLPPVRQALNSMETTAEALFPSDGTEVVTLQAVSLLALSWLPSRIAAFEVQNPDIRVSLTSGNAVADFRRILPGRGPDLQIIFGGTAEATPGAKPFLPENLSIVARRDIADVTVPQVSLSGRRLIDVAQHASGWSQMLAALNDSEVNGSVLSYVDSTPVAFALAAEGLGLALERAPASDGLRDAYGLVRVPGSPRLIGTEAYHIHTPGSSSPRRAVRLLRDFLIEIGLEPDT
ncbi:LysR family transcriptional regulator [Lutimaribacter marinistellae]|uniref:LysR family transcriptional regulator n=1 Tax=Lutimaribacter marinistellae TaxID=1820329 RepID=A0ABV7TAH5_9RHOB